MHPNDHWSLPARTRSLPMLSSEVEMRVQGDDLELFVHQPPEPGRAVLEALPWHLTSTTRLGGATLASRADRDIELRLAITGRDSAWQSHWLHWVEPVRSSLVDGAAGTPLVRRISEAELEVTLRAGEHCWIDFASQAALDAHTRTGSYDYDVVVADAALSACAIVPCRLRLAHPPAHWLEYLPTIYSASGEHASRRDVAPEMSFFCRFLRGFEDAMEPHHDLLGRMEELFDSERTSAEMLPWLASWVGLVTDDNWPEIRRRRLIKEAVELYRWRGTRRGLSRYLEIYTGLVPEIADRPAPGFRLGADCALGSGTRLGGIPPHAFAVTLVVDDPRQVDVAGVQRIIEAEKPAHTAYSLHVVERSEGPPPALPEPGPSLGETADVR